MLASRFYVGSQKGACNQLWRRFPEKRIILGPLQFLGDIRGAALPPAAPIGPAGILAKVGPAGPLLRTVTEK